MCSEWQTAGVSAIAAITSSVKSRGCGEVKRTRSSPSTAPAARSSAPNAYRSPNSRPYELTFCPSSVTSSTPCSTSARTSASTSPGAPVPLLAAQRRDDAEGAGVVAADRDRHPGRVRRVAPGRQHGREGLQRLADLDLRLLLDPRPLQQRRQRADVVGAEDDVHPGRAARDLAAVLLRQAAADRDLHARPGVLHRAEVAEVAVELVVRVLPDRAGVEHDDVRGGAGGRAPVARVLQQAGQPLGVVHVHLAAVGADLVRAGVHDATISPAPGTYARTTRAVCPAGTGPDPAARRLRGTPQVSADPCRRSRPGISPATNVPGGRRRDRHCRPVPLWCAP